MIAGSADFWKMSFKNMNKAREIRIDTLRLDVGTLPCDIEGECVRGWVVREINLAPTLCAAVPVTTSP